MIGIKEIDQKLCQEWQLEASSSDGRIQLTIINLDLEAHESGACVYDYLEIFFNSFSWKYCGDKIPPPFISSGTSMRVKFHSDNIGAKTGFLFKWEELEGNGCPILLDPLSFCHFLGFWSTYKGLFDHFSTALEICYMIATRILKIDLETAQIIEVKIATCNTKIIFLPHCNTKMSISK